ncbi:uncharacterized protein LOC126815859 isoform X2 [Patella vulgata]|uniref:uncharacterized protein LOC126815859 isoform X2 n=1 Tax=Patella vulgata TaxID=6465 RepID=UPI0024A87D02|nr:uncharacterized protein LOC126815859 isoform X2 [Patella vulgata]
MSQAAKLIYNERAREAENLPFNERPKSEQSDIKKGLLKQLDNILQKLHNCSVDVAAVAIEGITIHFLGPKDGPVLRLLRDKEEEMVDRVIRNKYAPNDNMKEDVRNIRKRAQEHFNQLYASATRSSKTFPYKAVDCGTIIIEGLPDELVPLKVPSKYGIAKLKKMLDVKLIHIKRNEQALTSTLHIPTDSHTIPQTDIDTITQADIQTFTQADIQTITQANIQTIPQAEIQFITQTDIDTPTQANNQTITQADIQTITQADNQTITQADIPIITQKDIYIIQETDIHTNTQTNTQIHLDTAVKGELNNDYEVERIVRKRRRRGTNEYLLRWKGFSSQDDTWEKEEHLNKVLLQIAKQI